jgi:hypothetical protein
MATTIHNVTGNHLNDKSLNNLGLGGSHETINVFGQTEMNLGIGTHGSDTVDLAAHSEWIGGFSSGPWGVMNINGKGSFDNTTSAMSSGSADIGVPVVGQGKFTIAGIGKMEFASSVSAGQTIQAGTGFASASQSTSSIVQIDKPAAFHALINLGFGGEVVLEGITRTSSSFGNDLLTLYNGNKVVDTLRLSIPAVRGSVIGGMQVGNSLVLRAAVDIHDSGLPLHG